jgi:hypothetical protein
MTVAENTPVTVNRNERIIAYMVASSLGLSLLCIIATLIGAGAGADRSVGIWPLVTILPTVGLPIGFVLIIVLLVMSAIRRSRAARDASQ